MANIGGCGGMDGVILGHHGLEVLCYWRFYNTSFDRRMCVEYIGIFYSPCNNTFICMALCLNPLNINTVIIDTWYEYEYKLYKMTVQVLISGCCKISTKGSMEN